LRDEHALGLLKKSAEYISQTAGLPITVDAGERLLV